MRKTGANLMSMMNASLGNQTSSNNTEINKPKRRMKGPNIDVSDIPDLSETSQPQKEPEK
jgi:hypothetical protein